MAERLIGIDAGGTMTKVAVFDAAGNELGCEHRPNGMLFPAPGRTERDPEAMWDATCEALRVVLERTGTRPGDVAAVTPSGFGAGVFVVDAAGATVRPGLVSTDSRAAEVIAGWVAHGVSGAAERIITAALWPGQTLAILGWFSQHEPDTLRRTAHVLACKDFLRLRLSGDVSTDPTDAGCAGLIDVAAGRYAEDALALLGLSAWRQKLPPIGPSTGIAGRVTAAAARRTGLAEGTPVARGVYDVVGCSLASGLAARDQLGIVAGTFSINSTLHHRPARDPLPTLQSAYPLGEQVIATIATPTSASNLEWIVKTLLGAEAERQKSVGGSIYDYCSRLVAESYDRPAGPLFFPYLYGGPEGAPAGLVGTRAGDGLGDVLRAVYEGIAFAHRADVETLLRGPDSARPERIVLSGGPARSDVFSQLFADALGMEVAIANGSEFGAKGGAMCGAVAAGLAADMSEAAAKMVRVVRRYAPDPVRGAALDASYRRYRAVGASLAQAWSNPAAPPPGTSAARAPERLSA